MKFRALQENLREALRERIEDGELTGLRLAKDTGFKQAHISNFLNRKRGLSVEGFAYSAFTGSTVEEVCARTSPAGSILGRPLS